MRKAIATSLRHLADWIHAESLSDDEESELLRVARSCLQGFESLKENVFCKVNVNLPIETLITVIAKAERRPK